MALLAAVALGSAFVALFVIHKFIECHHLSNIPYLEDYQFKLTSNVASAKAARRLTAYISCMVHILVARLGNSDVAGALIGLAAFIGVAFLAVRGFSPFPWRKANCSISWIGCSLFLVAAAPLLVVHQFTQTDRSLFTLTAIEMLAVVLAP